MYEYGINIKRVIDGDTIVADIDLGFGTWLSDKHIRLHGVNAPEKNTPEGVFAKKFTESWLTHDTAVYILSVIEHKSDKYGRILGNVYMQVGVTTKSLSEELIKSGNGTEYFGGKKNVS
jgi:endonuclease YncB( thermonuclease family)